MLKYLALKKGVNEASVSCPKVTKYNQSEVKTQGFSAPLKTLKANGIKGLVPRAGIEPARPIARNPGF